MSILTKNYQSLKAHGSLLTAKKKYEKNITTYISIIIVGINICSKQGHSSF